MNLTLEFSMTMRAVSVSLFATVTLAACGYDAPSPEVLPWSERDSAGVAVVQNRINELRADRWSLDPAPLLSIGGMDAPESHQVFRVSGAVRLPDGRLAVSSAGTFDIRIYDGSGALLARWGSEGDGPEEFREPALMGRYGPDTLVVFDARLSRISWVGAGSGVLGGVPISWSGKGYPIGQGLLPDGSILVGGGMSFSSDEGFPTGVIRPSSTFGWVARDGTEGAHLGDFLAAEMFARADARGFMARSLPFARHTVAAAAPDGIWLGTADAWELRLYGFDGGVKRVVRGARPPRPVTLSDRNAYVEAALAEASTDNEARNLRALLDEMPFPAEYPPYQSLEVDAEGCLWVQDYPAAEEEPASWTVLDPSGRGVARVVTPARTRVLEIGADYVLGVTTDALDVESVTLWRLHRS